MENDLIAIPLTLCNSERRKSNFRCNILLLIGFGDFGLTRCEFLVDTFSLRLLHFHNTAMAFPTLLSDQNCANFVQLRLKSDDDKKIHTRDVSSNITMVLIAVGAFSLFHFISSHLWSISRHNSSYHD